MPRLYENYKLSYNLYKIAHANLKQVICTSVHDQKVKDKARGDSFK